MQSGHHSSPLPTPPPSSSRLSKKHPEYGTNNKDQPLLAQQAETPTNDTSSSLPSPTTANQSQTCARSEHTQHHHRRHHHQHPNNKMMPLRDWLKRQFVADLQQQPQQAEHDKTAATIATNDSPNPQTRPAPRPPVRIDRILANLLPILFGVGVGDTSSNSRSALKAWDEQPLKLVSIALLLQEVIEEVLADKDNKVNTSDGGSDRGERQTWARGVEELTVGLLTTTAMSTTKRTTTTNDTDTTAGPAKSQHQQQQQRQQQQQQQHQDTGPGLGLGQHVGLDQLTVSTEGVITSGRGWDWDFDEDVTSEWESEPEA